MQEMRRMNIDILGIAETFWDGMGDSETTLPETKEKFRVIFSGGDKKRKGCKDRSLYKCSEHLLTKLPSNINVPTIFRWSLTLAVFETTAENNTRNSTKLNSLLTIIHGTSYRQLNNRTVQLLTI